MLYAFVILEGYGASVLNTMRSESNIEFPLTLGRDFCGEIVQKGLGVSSRDLDVGDEVWGVCPVHQQGSHAEYVVVERYCVNISLALILFWLRIHSLSIFLNF